MNVNIFRTFSENLVKNLILIVFRETEHKGQESPVIRTKRMNRRMLVLFSFFVSYLLLAFATVMSKIVVGNINKLRPSKTVSTQMCILFLML